MPDIDITILVATYNHAPLLPKLLASLEEQSYPSAQFEVVVADNASDDDTADVVRRYADGAPVRIRHVRLASQQGRGAALNAGLELAAGRYVLSFDDDLLAHPQLVAAHMTMHAAQSRACAVIGRIERHPQLPAGTGVRRLIPLPETLNPVEDSLSPLDWHAHNLSLPRQLLVSAGGFDPNYPGVFGLGEDLGYRLAGAGCHGHHAPGALAYSWRLANYRRDFEREYHRGYALYRLFRKTRLPQVMQRYPVLRGPLINYYGIVAGPVYEQVCQWARPESRLFEHVYRRGLQFARSHGYRDSVAGRPPRLLSHLPPPDPPARLPD